MTQQAVCPEHGPYDASLGACPFPHAGAGPRPSAPSPLDDNMPTEIHPGGGVRSFGVRAAGGEGETEIPGLGRGSGEGETEYISHEERGTTTELDEPESPFVGLMWAKEGPQRGSIFPIKHGIEIGSEVDRRHILLDEPKVSRRHARITMENGDFVIWDAGSTNGTMVNGRRIREATVLAENDAVKIGSSLLVVKLLEPQSGRRRAKSGAKRRRKAGTSR